MGRDWGLGPGLGLWGWGRPLAAAPVTSHLWPLAPYTPLGGARRVGGAGAPPMATLASPITPTPLPLPGGARRVRSPHHAAPAAARQRRRGGGGDGHPPAGAWPSALTCRPSRLAPRAPHRFPRPSPLYPSRLPTPRRRPARDLAAESPSYHPLGTRLPGPHSSPLPPPKTPSPRLPSPPCRLAPRRANAE